MASFDVKKIYRLDFVGGTDVDDCIREFVYFCSEVNDDNPTEDVTIQTNLNGFKMEMEVFHRHKRLPYEMRLEEIERKIQLWIEDYEKWRKNPNR